MRIATIVLCAATIISCGGQPGGGGSDDGGGDDDGPDPQPAWTIDVDLSGLDRLAAPLSAAHGLQLSGLQELEHVAPQSQPAAQLVLPAATRPPVRHLVVARDIREVGHGAHNVTS